MKQCLTALLLVFLLVGCDLDEAESVKHNISEETVWTFSQFNVPEDDGEIEDYYYYGRVSKSLYKKISRNEIQKGFILLQDVMYWGKDDLIHDYRDGEFTGDLIFRIEDVRRMRMIQKAPKAGFGSDQFEEQEKKKTTDKKAAPISSLSLHPASQSSGFQDKPD
jgi:hypothetical protein